MYDTQKINLVTLKQLENLFNVEKSNFNNLTYQPFKNSYLNVCSNVCVSKMAENLNMMYEQIQTSYGNISNWWNEYISNTEGLENSIATKTLIGGITESGLSSFISTHLCNFTIYNTNILELNNYLKPTNINEVESKNAEESNLLETAADYTITGIGSFLFGVLDVVEQIGDGVIMLGGTVASLVASDKEAVQEWTKNVISYDWTDAGYDALVDFADVDEDIAYGTLHNVTQAAGTMVGYAALTYLTAGAGTAIAGTGTGATAVAATIKTALDAGIGYMAASGEASQRAFNNGATYQEAFVSSQVSGAMGAVSGVALDKLGVAAKGGQGILPKVGYAVAGMGVAAAEPVVNNVVDYNLYAKDMVNETGNKVYNNFGDYYVKSGGLTNTLMAGGIGAVSVGLQGLSKKISDVDGPNKLSDTNSNVDIDSSSGRTVFYDDYTNDLIMESFENDKNLFNYEKGYEKLVKLSPDNFEKVKANVSNETLIASFNKSDEYRFLSEMVNRFENDMSIFDCKDIVHAESNASLLASLEPEDFNKVLKNVSNETLLYDLTIRNNSWQGLLEFKKRITSFESELIRRIDNKTISLNADNIWVINYLSKENYKIVMSSISDELLAKSYSSSFIKSSFGSKFMVNGTINDELFVEEIINRQKQGKNILDLFSLKEKTNLLLGLSKEQYQSLIKVMPDDAFLRSRNISKHNGHRFFSDELIEVFETEFLERFEKNKNILLEEDGFDVFQKLTIDTKSIIDEKISLQFDSLISKNINYNNYKNISLDLYDKIKILYIDDLGYLNENSSQLILQLYDKNPYVFKTINGELLNPEIINLGYDFLKKMSVYPKISDKLIKIYKNDNKSYEIFRKVYNTFNDNDCLTSSDMKTHFLIDFLSNNDNKKLIDSINLDGFLETDYNELMSYIIKNKDIYSYAINNSGYNTTARSIIEVTFDDFRDYRSKFNLVCDSLMEKTSDVFEAKNILLNKYFDITKEEADTILKMYSKNFDSVSRYDSIGAATDYIRLLRTIDGIDDIDVIKTMYYDSGMKHYSAEMLLSLEGEIKKVYAKSLLDQLAKTKDIVDSQIKTGTNITNVNYNGKKVNVVNMSGDYNLLVNSTAAYGEMPLINNSFLDSWNLSERTNNHGICCSLIGNNMLGMAEVKDSGVMFGFFDFSDEALSLEGPYDIFSKNDNYSISSARMPQYVSGEDIVSNTRHTHNEVVIERKELRSGDYKYNNIQPDYLVYSSNMSESVKNNTLKAAAEMDIPVLYVDVNYTATRESNKILNTLQQFSNTKDLSLLSNALDNYESNRSGMRMIEDYNFNDYLSKETIEGVFIDYIDYLKTLNDKEYVSQQFNEIKEILLKEKSKFDVVEIMTGRRSSFDIDYELIFDRMEE